MYPLKGLGIFRDLLLFKERFKALNKVCKTKVDLPLPDTPVTQENVPKGIFKLMFFKLFPVAPKISKNFPYFADLLIFGICIYFFLDK